MVFPTITGAQRPNSIDPVDMNGAPIPKGEEYDVQWARFILQTSDNIKMLRNTRKYFLNYQFWKGNQWICREDIDSFLTDIKRNPRMRVAWVNNQIEPLQKKYLDQAIKTSFQARAYGVSMQKKDAKDMELATRLQVHAIAENMPRMKPFFKAKYNLGDTPQETEQNFHQDYSDDAADAVNALFRHQEALNRFDVKKKQITDFKFLSGIGIMKRDFYADDMFWNVIDPALFFWDISAMDPDLGDSEFMGDINFGLPTQIYERWNVSPANQKAIERTLNRDSSFWMDRSAQWVSSFAMPYNKMPIYNTYWHDTNIYFYGYVQEESGNVRMARMVKNERDINKDIIYSFKDAMKYEDLNESQRKNVNSDGIIKKSDDVIRFCKFIPKEMLFNSRENIVLDHGMLEYQESYMNNPFDSKMPYKITTADYHNGDLVSPVDKMIDPQRLINRMISGGEMRFNTARGSGSAIDKRLLDDVQQVEIDAKMNRGENIYVDATVVGGNIQNAITQYDGVPAIKSAQVSFEIAEQVKNMLSQETGANDAVMGSGKSSKVLVGVQQNDLVQGLSLQAGFHDGTADMFLSIYECISSAGRRFYSDNESTLYDVVGDEAKVIRFTRNMKLESMHVKMRMVDANQTSVEYNNQMLLQLYQLQLIGKEEFAALWNNAETDQVGHMIRQYLLKEQQAAAEAAKQPKPPTKEEVALQIAGGKLQDNAANRQFMNEQNDKKLGIQRANHLDSGTNKIIVSKMNNQAKAATMKEGGNRG